MPAFLLSIGLYFIVSDVLLCRQSIKVIEKFEAASVFELYAI